VNLKVEIKNKQPTELNSVLTSYDYLRLYSCDVGWICGYSRGVLCCAVPFIKKRKWFFNYIQMLSGVVYLRPKVVNEKEFLNLSIAKIKEIGGIDFISQPKTSALFNDYPDESIHTSFGSYIINLAVDKQSLWASIHSKHKNVIRRAIKNNISVKFGIEVFDDAYLVIYKTLLRNNIALIDKNKLENLEKSKDVKMLVGCSYLGDVVQSAAIILYDDRKGYYFWGGAIEKPSLGSNNLLHWKIIKHLKHKGVKEYDFVGARLDTINVKMKGIQRFKSRFGSELRQGYLWKLPINKWKYNLFSFLYRIKMKKGDLIDQEKNNTNF
jgi:lipid II:glycine glycyltransferase (peptidoglycan interpeptide bridge formation enzyme)